MARRTSLPKAAFEGCKTAFWRRVADCHEDPGEGSIDGQFFGAEGDDAELIAWVLVQVVVEVADGNGFDAANFFLDGDGPAIVEQIIGESTASRGGHVSAGFGPGDDASDGAVEFGLLEVVGEAIDFVEKGLVSFVASIG